MRKRAPEAYARAKPLGLARRARVMGILNVTPDSFSDGGRCFGAREAVRHGLSMAAAGADIIDVGGESTRPGAKDIPVDEECRRVIPVIRELARRVTIPVSIDTRKSAVAEAAIAAGASVINDVSGLSHDPALARVAARTGAALIIMHMRGTPRTMQRAPRYADVTKECISFLRKAVAAARRAGVAEKRIIIDPGIGFGKTVAQNFALLARQNELLQAGYPLLAGWSRKSPLGAVSGLEVGSRIIPSIAAALLAVERGARVVRVHDVAETVQALTVWQAASNAVD